MLSYKMYFVLDFQLKLLVSCTGICLSLQIGKMQQRWSCLQEEQKSECLRILNYSALSPFPHSNQETPILGRQRFFTVAISGILSDPTCATEPYNEVTQKQAVRLGRVPRAPFIERAHVYCLFGGEAAQHKQWRTRLQAERSQHHPANSVALCHLL